MQGILLPSATHSSSSSLALYRPFVFASHSPSQQHWEQNTTRSLQRIPVTVSVKAYNSDGIGNLCTSAPLQFPLRGFHCQVERIMELLHGAYIEIDRRVAISSNYVLSAFKNVGIAPNKNDHARSLNHMSSGCVAAYMKQSRRSAQLS